MRRRHLPYAIATVLAAWPPVGADEEVVAGLTDISIGLSLLR